MSNADIDAAISQIQSAARDALRKVAEQEEKRKKAEEKARHEAGTKRADADAKGGSAPASDPAATAKPEAAAAEKAPTVVYWIFAGVVVIVVAGVAWYFVRRKLFSHDIEQRYALYLSTLSYQQLRAKHGGNVELANRELADHLRFIRGDTKAGADIAKRLANAAGKHAPFFESVQSLPLPIEIRTDPEFIKYLEHSATFV